MTSRLKTFCNLIHVLNLYKHINNQLTFMLYYSYISNQLLLHFKQNGKQCTRWWCHMHIRLVFNGIFCLLQQNGERVPMLLLQWQIRFGTISFISCAFKRPCLDIILRFLYFVFFRITSCINPRHKYHLENFSSRDDIGRG